MSDINIDLSHASFSAGLSLDQINTYLDFRGMHHPDALDALQFSATELSEVAEVLLSFQKIDLQSTKVMTKLRLELGDTYQMLQLACCKFTNMTMEACFAVQQDALITSESVMHKTSSDWIVGIPAKFSVVALYLIGKLFDSYTRTSSKWVRNNPEKTEVFQLVFADIFLCLNLFSLTVCASSLSANLEEKWALKGFKL